jgi:hypothetical protein
MSGSQEEVGRWQCEKCGKSCVAVARVDKKFRGTGAFMGACPYGCGAWINRAFRFVKPGTVSACTVDEWERRAATT